MTPHRGRPTPENAALLCAECCLVRLRRCMQAAAALASASVLLRTQRPADAASYLQHARDLYAWGAEVKGECILSVVTGCVCLK